MKRDIQFYKDFDFSEAEIIKHPLIAKLQERKRQADELAEKHKELGLDADVIGWLAKQDTDTQSHINDMIRHAIALQTKPKNTGMAV